MPARRLSYGPDWEVVYGVLILCLMALVAGIAGRDFLNERRALAGLLLYTLSVAGAAGVGVLAARSRTRWPIVIAAALLVTHGAWGLVPMRMLDVKTAYAALLVAALPIVAARRIALDSPRSWERRAGLNAWLAVLVALTPLAILSLRQSADFLVRNRLHVATMLGLGVIGQFVWWHRIVDLRTSGLAEVAISLLTAVSPIGLVLSTQVSRRAPMILVGLGTDFVVALAVCALLWQGAAGKGPPAVEQSHPSA